MKRLGANKDLNLDNFAWSNKSAEVVKELTCYVPKKIHNVVRSANTALVGQEFSFLLKCEIDWEEGMVTVSEDWYFPKQVVTSVSVDYKEDMSEYNGVMHKHPGKMRNFSGTDDKWINQNFQVSILWIDDEFCNGRINIPTPAGKVQLPLTVVVEPDFEVMDDVVKIVEEKASKPAPKAVGTRGGVVSGKHPTPMSQTVLWGSGAANFPSGGSSHPMCNPDRVNWMDDDDFEFDYLSGGELCDDDGFAWACAQAGCLEGLDGFDMDADPHFVDAEGTSLQDKE